MAALGATLDARCPVCGAPTLSLSRGGRVLAEDLHPIPLYKSRGAEGYMVCDECGLLAEQPADLTLN